MSVRCGLGKDEAYDELEVVVSLRNVITWIVQIGYGAKNQRQVTALLNMTGPGMPKLHEAA